MCRSPHRFRCFTSGARVYRDNRTIVRFIPGDNYAVTYTTRCSTEL